MIFFIPIIFGILGAVIAPTKGRSGFNWFCLCFLLPVIALVCLIFSSDLKKQGIKSTKQCPKCAERVKKEATICKHCSHEFDMSAVEVLLPQSKNQKLAGLALNVVIGVLALFGLTLAGALIWGMWHA